MDELESFAKKLKEFDLGLFSLIPGQSDSGDRRSWLAVQRSIRHSGYTYLETGSYLGGSIQQHLVDPLCTSIVSIDRRSPSSPDDRGDPINYPDNTTENMLANLRNVDASAISKITAFDKDAKDINPADICAPPKFCFID